MSVKDWRTPSVTVTALSPYAVGVLRGDNLAAAFFKCLLVTSYTSLRGGLALDIRQNNNLSALTNLLGYILAALICSVLVRRADKGFRLIKIGVNRQNRNLCPGQCISIWSACSGAIAIASHISAFTMVSTMFS